MFLRIVCWLRMTAMRRVYDGLRRSHQQLGWSPDYATKSER
jgi:hypothetical protein